MRRNYTQSSRNAARPRAGAGRRTHTESYNTSGRGGRSGARRSPQPQKNNNQGVVIGLLIACAAIVLIVIVFAMSGSDDSGLDNKLKDGEPEKYQPNTDKANIVSSEPKKTDKEPAFSNKKDKKDNQINEEDFDDDDDWSRKDPDFKGKSLGNRDKFKK